MKNNPSIKDFLSYANPIIKTENFKQLKKYKHHANHTVYRHVLIVAYLSYKKAFSKKNINMPSLIKAALLHDYYLYDWHIKSSHKGLHGFTHPKVSMTNANRDFKLTKKEKGIILNHMWPLTFFNFPKSREAWILCLCDKKAAIYEYKVDKKKQKQ